MTAPLEPLAFRPSARLQRYLGQELISDPNLAVLEFVKNAYDAGATKVHLEFRLRGPSPSLQVSDNGTGMTEAEFRQYWMQPGYSHKAEGAMRLARATTAARSQARQLEMKRIPSGEKGLGRMAAGRLGERLDVYTRPSASSPWLHVPFEWSKFDNMETHLEDVKIQAEWVDSAPAGAFETGTVIVISSLTQRWGGKVRGRPAAGRSKTTLGRLRQDLQYFLRPLRKEFGSFEIAVATDVVADKADNDPLQATAAPDAGYRYEFSFKQVDGAAFVERTIYREAPAAAHAGKPETEHLGPREVSLVDHDGRSEPAPLACGEFVGEFVYSPPAAASRAAKISPFGVLLYRDGFWVEPYGNDENDWLLVNARKAARQGHAAIQPNAFTGQVSITRKRNPLLQDMSNRMGLIENEASEEFILLIHEEFRFFESIIQGEVIDPRWEQNQSEEAQARALTETEAASTYIKSLAHSVRQPLEALQGERVLMDQLVQRDLTDPDSVAKLKASVRRAKDYMDAIARWVEVALTFDVPRFEQVALAALVGDVVSGLSEQDIGRLEIGDVLPSAKVVVSRSLVVGALSDVITNALQAITTDGRATTVRLQVVRGDGAWVVTVEDDGGGIEGHAAGSSLSTISSTRGRPAMGLRLAERAMIASRGKLTLLQTGVDGTVFEFRLPSSSRGLPAGSSGDEISEEA